MTDENPGSEDGHSYVRGHLLNAHLGGADGPDNLVPATAEANAAHGDVETGVSVAVHCAACNSVVFTGPEAEAKEAQNEHEGSNPGHLTSVEPA